MGKTTHRTNPLRRARGSYEKLYFVVFHNAATLIPYFRVMKYTRLPLIALFLASCSAKYIPYHSTAHNPRETNSISTAMDLIMPVDSIPSEGEFAVIAAVDDSDQIPSYYVIVAPAVFPRKIDDVFLGHSATIIATDVREMIGHLDDMLKEWDQKTPDTAAVVYEFSTQTEMPIPSSTSIIATRNFVAESQGPMEDGWVPSIDLSYNRTSGGSAMTLQIGTPKFAHRYVFTKKKEVRSLKIQFEDALKVLAARGMR